MRKREYECVGVGCAGSDEGRVGDFTGIEGFAIFQRKKHVRVLGAKLR